MTGEINDQTDGQTDMALRAMRAMKAMRVMRGYHEAIGLV